MLKGHVFSKQIFESHMFALFINTFTNGENGVSNNYKNGMKPTYNGSTVSIDSGAVCIQGRLLEEDTSSQIAAGTNNAYCKLVIEIDLDKQNTESELNQVSYKIITATSNYPSLTQTNIVKNNSGIYQYELARFKTSASGITDFQDMRTFLDFDSIFEEIRQEYRKILQELQDELASVVDGSDYLLKSAGGTVEGEIKANGGLSGELIPTMLLNENLNELKTTGFYYAYGGNTVSNKPTGINNFSLLVTRTGSNAYSQILVDDKGNIYSRSSNENGWNDWLEYFSDKSIAILTGTIAVSGNDTSQVTKTISYPTGFNKENTVVIAAQTRNKNGSLQRWMHGGVYGAADVLQGLNSFKVLLDDDNIVLEGKAILLDDDQVHIFDSLVNYDYKIVLLKSN